MNDSEENNFIQNNNDQDDNPRPIQRARMELVPFENTIKVQSIMNRLHSVTLSSLISEDSDSMNLNLNYIDLQLLRVIAPSQQQGTHTAYVYHSRGGRNKQNSEVKYSRLFLFKCFSEQENGKLCYMMETKMANQNLWNHNVELRDNGSITVGSIVRVVAPLPVKTLMSGDIAMLETGFPFFLMTHPR